MQDSKEELMRELFEEDEVEEIVDDLLWGDQNTDLDDSLEDLFDDLEL